ncbi:MAG: rRNA maturation RNase YbeY [Candidatus Eutrophobiaceae bacterium]
MKPFLVDSRKKEWVERETLDIHQEIVLSVRCVCTEVDVPSEAQLQRWVALAVEEGSDSVRSVSEPCALAILIVGEAEGQELNRCWRKKDAPTNVLSFPAGSMPGFGSKLLGDLVLCAPVVAQEALAQGKELTAHWAHLTIHGTLHLLGYDHERERDAEKMEALEIRLLGCLGYRDPYQTGDI